MQTARISRKLRQHRPVFCLSRNASTTSTLAVASDADRDIVILGGGVVGLALALALGRNSAIRNNYKVTLLEGSDLSKIAKWKLPSDQFSNRVVSITNQSRAFLQDIQAWGHVEAERTQKIRDMQVWDGLSKARIHLDAREVASKTGQRVQSMSTMTEILNLQRGLLNAISDSGHKIEIQDRTKVQSIEKQSAESGEWPIVHLDTGKQLRPRLLVGADGPNSPVRKYAGIETTGWMYGSQGVVATMNVTPFLDENETAWQRFLPTGPIALLPLPNDMASLVWSTKADIAARLKALSPEALSAMVNAAFQLPYDSIQYLYDLLLQGVSDAELLKAIEWRSSYEVLGPEDMPSPFSGQYPPEVVAIQAGSVASFPLRYSHSNTYLGETGPGSTTAARTVLVGDAAHSMHPLAGQGLNAGLADAQALCDVIGAAVDKGMDIGTLTALADYPRSRWTANHNLMSAVDKLHKLYAREEAPVVWARSAGLELVNEIGPLKRFFMQQAGADTEKRNSMSLSNRLLENAGQLYSAASSVRQAVATGTGLLRSRLARQ